MPCRRLLLMVWVALLGWAVTPVGAGPITFTGTSGDRSASVTFDVSGTDLIVTLTNTSLADALVPVDILTAVFFTLAGDPVLTPVSAVLNNSVVFFGGTDAGGVVGGEWAYNTGLSSGSPVAPGGANAGISSTGLDLFGPGDRFPGTNLQGPDSPDGLQYGITTAGDLPATGNTPVTDGSNNLIQNSVIFTLSDLPGGFDPMASGSITNVSFQYGTALDEPNVPADDGDGGGGGGGGSPVPEPSTVLLFGSGLLALGLWGKRKYRQNS